MFGIFAVKLGSHERGSRNLAEAFEQGMIAAKLAFDKTDLDAQKTRIDILDYGQWNVFSVAVKISYCFTVPKSTRT